ncbi:hypothetical protein LX36DRAFT_710863 [Colletotrichum falcatum]|nr:hypothetical protein LX36DRAFT_710863 [Colletotrichum falcatum]
MFSKKRVGSLVEALNLRRPSTSSTASSSSPSPSPRSSTFSIFSRSGTSSRSGSVASLNAMGRMMEEHEHLMAEEPKRAAYVPQHAAKSFMSTATSKEIRKNGEIL